MFVFPIAIHQIDAEAYANPPVQTCEYQIVAVAFDQRQHHNLVSVRPDVAVSTQTDATRGESLIQLLQLSKLGSHWDGYGADPIDGACVANAEAILRALPGSAPSPEITPNPNGTLSLDWESGHQALSLEIGIDRYSCFWESSNGIQTDEGDFAQGLPAFVATVLANLFPPQATLVFPDYEGPIFDAQGQSGQVTSGHLG